MELSLVGWVPRITEGHIGRATDEPKKRTSFRHQHQRVCSCDLARSSQWQSANPRPHLTDLRRSPNTDRDRSRFSAPISVLPSPSQTRARAAWAGEMFRATSQRKPQVRSASCSSLGANYPVLQLPEWRPGAEAVRVRHRGWSPFGRGFQSNNRSSVRVPKE